MEDNCVYYYTQVVLPLGSHTYEFQDVGPGWDDLQRAKDDLAMWRRAHPSLNFRLVDHRGPVE